MYVLNIFSCCSRLFFLCSRRNAPVDGRPKAIQYVDPWGSVARTFKDNSAANGSQMGGQANGSQMGGQGNGSQMGSQRGPQGSQTAQSSASA